MPDNEPQPSIIPNFESEREAALSWINAVANDIELDGLVVSPDGAALWQKIMGEHLFDVSEPERLEAIEKWRNWYKPKLDADIGVREKNIFLASLANEVEVELSANGIYLRNLLSGMERVAHESDDPGATARSQFMGLWVARKIKTESES